MRANNDGLIALASKNPKLMPIATVHPYDGAAAIAELERVAARGVKVLKLHPHTQKFDAADPRVRRLTERAGQLGMIVLFDNASIVPDDCEKLFNLALEVPKTQFIFAHLGAMNFRFWNILKAARTAEGLFADNIYFDLSATVVIVADSPIEDEFVWTVRNVGVDHVLFGSDYPQYSVEQNARALDRLGLDDSEKAKIRFGNAQKLFGLQLTGIGELMTMNHKIARTAATILAIGSQSLQWPRPHWRRNPGCAQAAPPRPHPPSHLPWSQVARSRFACAPLRPRRSACRATSVPTWP